MKARNTLVLIYNSFRDPLFQNLMLGYLKTLSESTRGDFHLITFEQPEYRVSEIERQQINKNLSEYRIYWHPLTFHTGRWLLFKKMWDFGMSFLTVASLRFRFNLSILFCFANVSAAMGIVLAKIFRMTMIVYSYEPHSEFMADFGYWSRSGLKYRILHNLEEMAGKDAEFILTGTRHMVDRLENEGSSAHVYRAPTAVDANQFRFDPSQRKIIRDRLNVHDREVFIYVGKFGGLYYEEEIAVLCNNIDAVVPESFFLILTPNESDTIQQMFLKYLDKQKFHVTFSRDSVCDYLSASDFGISVLPPYPSQRYRSPTKVAEYLLVGLPYVTSEGVSEDDEVAWNEDVGVVIADVNDLLQNTIAHKIRLLLDEESSKRRERCRKAGLKYRSKDRIDKILADIYADFNQ